MPHVNVAGIHTTVHGMKWHYWTVSLTTLPHILVQRDCKFMLMLHRAVTGDCAMQCLPTKRRKAPLRTPAEGRHCDHIGS